MATIVKHSLPYKICSVARHCTAPFHFSRPDLRFCIDFYLPQGTPILASRSGVVSETESRYNKSYQNIEFVDRCNYIVIRHGNGEETMYAHLSWHSVKVRVGQRVKRGQVIGLSGQTGCSTYLHLHFGAYDALGSNIRPIFNTGLPSKTSYMRYSLDKEFLIICK